MMKNAAHVPSLALQERIADKRVINAQVSTLLKYFDGIVRGYTINKWHEASYLDVEL